MRFITIRIPYIYATKLQESQSLWDSHDHLKYEKNRKLPNKKKIIKKLVYTHLIKHGLIDNFK